MLTLNSLLEPDRSLKPGKARLAFLGPACLHRERGPVLGSHVVRGSHSSALLLVV